MLCMQVITNNNNNNNNNCFTSTIYVQVFSYSTEKRWYEQPNII